MKTFLNLSILLVVAIAVSACGAQNISPTATSVATEIAASNTPVELPTTTALPPTIAPTVTPVPTETPATILATEAPTEMPSPEATAIATLSSLPGGTADPCNKQLQGVSGGKIANIKIQNNSGAPITVSLYLNPTPFGDCGYRGYTLGKYNSIFITDLIEACYNIAVFIQNPKKQINAFAYGCINNNDKWSFIVTKDSVSLQGR